METLKQEGQEKLANKINCKLVPISPLILISVSIILTRMETLFEVDLFETKLFNVFILQLISANTWQF